MQDVALSNPFSSATVAVVGLGKIGLPLAVQYALHGHRVIGCDTNPRVVESVNAGYSHIQEEPGLAEQVADLVSRDLLSATCDTALAVRQASVVVVIVPVAITEGHRVDFQMLDSATLAIGTGLQPGTLVIYETTLPVATTSTRLAPLLEQTSQLKAGADFLLAFSPERVSSGSIFRDLRIYPKIVGGLDTQSTEAVHAFYRSVLDPSTPIITMASTEDAEFVKLIETTYRDVNIALANEFARYADYRGLDVASAITAANTQPYSHIHTPGVGVGGHCIPVYPHFLLADVAPLDAEAETPQEPLLQLPRLARQINDDMAEYAVSRIEAVIGPLRERSALILGVAYRGDVRETAFTSAKLLQTALLKRGAQVFADDPLFTDTELRASGYTPLSPDDAEKISAIVLQTAHRAYQTFDFRRFAHCHLLLDGRDFFNQEHIESLGMHYITIGDGHLTNKHTSRRESRNEYALTSSMCREEEITL